VLKAERTILCWFGSALELSFMVFSPF